MILLLMRNRWRILTSAFRGGVMQNKRSLFKLVGLLIVPLLIFFQINNLFRMWAVNPETGMALIRHFVSISMFGLSFMLVFTGLPVVLHHHFLADDLSLLSALPISKKVIFQYKFLDTCISNFGFFFAFGFPIFLAVFLTLDAFPLFLLPMLIVSILFIMIPTGISTLIAFLLARFFPIKKTRKLATLVMALLILAGWASVQFFRFSQLDPVSLEYSAETVQSFKALGSSFSDIMVLPSNWLASVLFYPLHQNLAMFIIYSFIVFASGLIFLLFCGELRFRLEEKGAWNAIAARSQGVSAQNKKKMQTLPLLPTLLMKENRIIFRDTRMLQSNLIFLAIIIVLPFFSDNPVDSSETLSMVSSYTPLTIFVVLASSSLTRLSIPLEQFSFFYLKIAPRPWSLFLSAKLIRNVLPVIVAVTISIAISASRNPISTANLFYITGGEWLLAIGAGAVGLMFGAKSARFDWTDPRYMVSAGASYVSTFIALVCAVIGLTILGIGLYLNQQVIAFVLFFVYVLFLFQISSRSAAKYLERLEWIY